jgi:hypothetical protein
MGLSLELGNRDAWLVGPIAGVETLGDQPGIAVRHAKPKMRSAGSSAKSSRSRA